MWHVFIEFGGLVFWGLLALAMLVEFLFVSREKLAEAFGVFAGLLVILIFFSSVPIIQFVKTDWSLILKWAGIYIGMGVAWTVARWILFALKRKNFFYDCRDQWFEANARQRLIDSKDLATWGLVVKMDFLWWFDERFDEKRASLGSPYESIETTRWPRRNEATEEDVKLASKDVLEAVIPKARQHKSKITVWMFFWPFSIICYFLEDLIVDAARALIRQMSRILSGINKAIFSGMKKDLQA